MIGTLNNKNIDNFYFAKIKDISVTGLDEENNLKLIKDLNFLKINNLFSLDEKSVKELLNSNNLIEKYYVFKQYPSKLNVKIDETILLAKIKKKNIDYYLGSNGKLIKKTSVKKDVPTLFGEFDNKSFFELKGILDKKNFNYFEIKNLFFFKSGRWDIEKYDGLLIKLPKDNLEKSVELLNNFLTQNHKNKITKIDLRQSNQIIVDEK